MVESAFFTLFSLLSLDLSLGKFKFTFKIVNDDTMLV